MTNENALAFSTSEAVNKTVKTTKGMKNYLENKKRIENNIQFRLKVKNEEFVYFYLCNY